MRCAYCPVRAEIACISGGHPFPCERLDPAHPRYAPEYGPVYVRHSEEAARPPSAAQMAANLARSLWDWAVSGFSMADEVEQARRLEICRACPQWRDGRCLICGCFLDAKIRLKTEHCPLDPPKW